MREAQSGPSSADLPASAKSATHSFSRARKSGRHRNFPVSFQLSAEMPRLVSSTSRAPRYTSQHTSNASSGLTPMAPPLSPHPTLLPRTAVDLHPKPPHLLTVPVIQQAPVALKVAFCRSANALPRTSCE